MILACVVCGCVCCGQGRTADTTHTHREFSNFKIIFENPSYHNFDAFALLLLLLLLLLPLLRTMCRSLSFVSKVTPKEVKSCYQPTAEVSRTRSAFVLLLKDKKDGEF
jgi:hypothetical protein